MVHRKKFCRLCDFVGGDGNVLHEHEKWRHGDDFSKDYGFRKGSFYCKHHTCATGIYDKEYAMLQHINRVHGVQTPAESGSNSNREDLAVIEDDIEVLPIRSTGGARQVTRDLKDYFFEM